MSKKEKFFTTLFFVMCLVAVAFIVQFGDLIDGK